MTSRSAVENRDSGNANGSSFQRKRGSILILLSFQRRQAAANGSPLALE
ncbi:hypothetical protein [Luteimonas salinilitoris]|uniref:Uncharacterized protein n=1 Tax=Luteimonas salinilitoris TaxID=3237697 RepID=A0ABV4HS46_9GAMM